MMTCDIDTSRAVAALDGLAAALGKDKSDLLKDECRLLSKTITAFVPPLRGPGGSPEQVGKQAIGRELTNLISEADVELMDKVGSEHGVSNINDVWLTKKDGEKIELLWGNLDPTGNRLPEFHEQYRDQRTGKVKTVKGQSGKWKARVVVPKGIRDAFIRKTQAHVGAWKASWARAGAELGQKFPRWITKHFSTSAPLGVVDLIKANDPTYPTITFGSRAPGNGRMQQRIQAAVKSRARSMARRTKLILSGYSKDISQGMKAQYRAKRTPANDDGGTVE